MSAPKRYTITAALPYTNGPIHIGHLAGVYVPADIYARYLRGIGKDVAYICGSDEHGVAIPMRAKKEGVSPKDIIDKYHSMIKKSFADFGISFDNVFVSESRHSLVPFSFTELRVKQSSSILCTWPTHLRFLSMIISINYTRDVSTMEDFGIPNLIVPFDVHDVSQLSHYVGI